MSANRLCAKAWTATLYYRGIHGQGPVLFDLTVRTRRRQLSIWHLAVMRSISQRVRWIRTPPAKCLRYSRDKVVLRSAAAGGRIVVVYCMHCSLSFADTSHSVRTRFNDTVHRRRSRSRGERGLWGPYVLPRITRQSQIRTFSLNLRASRIYYLREVADMQLSFETI